MTRATEKPTTRNDLHAMVGSAHYSIPQMWLAGYCRGGATVQEAVTYWHQQAEMERKVLAVARKPRKRGTK